MTNELTAPQGSIACAKDALVKDLKSVVGDADALMKEVANATTEEFSAMYTRIEGKLDRARSSLDDARFAVTGRARAAADATQDYVMENPWKSAGIAAIGLFVGFLLSRKS